VSDDLSGYIKAELAKKTSDSEIISFLSDKGWSVGEIHNALSVHRGEKTRAAHKTFKKFVLWEIPLWFSFFMVVFCSAVAAGTVILIGKENIYSYVLTDPEATHENNYLTYGEQPSLSDPDYFGKVRQQFIDEKIDFIEANLDTMKLFVYEDGQPSIEVPILAKGKDGAWWETPAGLYKVESKERNHYSSFGNVYQPWSMRFQGNFYIHGWPYYKDGTPVSSQFSGGCIRLSDESAKRVYDSVKTGTPVLVYERYFAPDSFVYKEKKPAVSAQNYLAADLRNNFVFVEKDAEALLPIASITKLISALVTTEHYNLDSTLTINEDMIIKTSKPRLKPGMNLGIYELLKLMLVESSNEAALALAEYRGEKSFVSLMNEKARALGLTHTFFVDSYGGGDENVSSAEELFSLAKYLYNNRSFILALTADKLARSPYEAAKFKDIANFNYFASRADFLGGKKGQTTAAHETMVALFEVEISGEKRPIAIIVLQSEDSDGDVEKILQYIKNRFRE